MIVWLSSSTTDFIKLKSSLLDFESRFPDGSSANITSGFVAIALAAATLCCCPPDSSLGLCVNLSPISTVSTTCLTHSISGFLPAIDAGSVIFSSAVKVGIKLKA